MMEYYFENKNGVHFMYALRTTVASVPKLLATIQWDVELEMYMVAVCDKIRLGEMPSKMIYKMLKKLNKEARNERTS